NVKGIAVRESYSVGESQRCSVAEYQVLRSADADTPAYSRFACYEPPVAFRGARSRILLCGLVLKLSVRVNVGYCFR
ncbi:MAG: hypothetical protein IJF90_02710, partial [Synergistaceae bacterium]|nr:hypothetical protein [Synergistaceae bacterium]